MKSRSNVKLNIIILTMKKDCKNGENSMEITLDGEAIVIKIYRL